MPEKTSQQNHAGLDHKPSGCNECQHRSICPESQATPGEAKKSTEIALEFRIGQKAVLVSGDGGCGATASHSAVSISINNIEDDGTTGGPEDVKNGVGRAEVFSAAISLLSIAQKMMSETAFARSEAVMGEGRAPNVSHTEHPEDVIKQITEVAKVRHENLRRRMHILQRAQLMLEVVDETTARQLDILLTMLEANGALPIHFAAIPPEAVQAMQEARKNADAAPAEPFGKFEPKIH